MADTTIALPFAVDGTGSIGKRVNFADQLTDRVFCVIATEPGERAMAPLYGANMQTFAWALMDATDIARVTEEITSALTKFEPDATLESVNILPPDASGSVIMTITYQPSNPSQALANGRQVRQFAIGTFDASGQFTESQST